MLNPASLLATEPTGQWQKGWKPSCLVCPSRSPISTVEEQGRYLVFIHCNLAWLSLWNRFIKKTLNFVHCSIISSHKVLEVQNSIPQLLEACLFQALPCLLLRRFQQPWPVKDCKLVDHPIANSTNLFKMHFVQAMSCIGKADRKKLMPKPSNVR